MEDDNRLAVAFAERLQRLGLKVARHRVIPGYPTNLDLIVSPEGFGRNEYAETTRDLVVVTAAGAGFGEARHVPQPGVSRAPPGCERRLRQV